MEATGRTGIVGDGDPLDVCVLSTRAVDQCNITLTAIPIGGFRMIDKGEADDKIVCVIEGDAVMKEWTDLTDAPEALVNLVKHYFLTYKLNPSSPEKAIVEIPEVYGREAAFEVIRAAQQDYHDKYGNMRQQFTREIVKTIRTVLSEDDQI